MDIYYNTGTTKFTFNDGLVTRLAKLPNVAAVKMPLLADGDFARGTEWLRAITPKASPLATAGDWGAADALLAGCDAWYSEVAGLLPVPALAITRSASR